MVACLLLTCGVTIAIPDTASQHAWLLLRTYNPQRLINPQILRTGTKLYGRYTTILFHMYVHRSAACLYGQVSLDPLLCASRSGSRDLTVS